MDVLDGSLQVQKLNRVLPFSAPHFGWEGQNGNASAKLGAALVKQSRSKVEELLHVLVFQVRDSAN